MMYNTLHKDKTVALAAGLPIAMVLLLVPALAEAHGEESFFLPLGQLLALVPVTIIAWRLTRGIIARVVVIFCALIASVIVATLVALLWRRLSR